MLGGSIRWVVKASTTVAGSDPAHWVVTYRSSRRTVYPALSFSGMRRTRGKIAARQGVWGKIRNQQVAGSTPAGGSSLTASYPSFLFSSRLRKNGLKHV